MRLIPLILVARLVLIIVKSLNKLIFELDCASNQDKLYPWSCIVELSDNKFASSENTNIYIWDIDIRKCIKRIDSGSYIRALLGLPDKRLLSAHNDNTVKIWDIETSDYKGILLKSDCTLKCMELLSKDYVVIGNDNGLIQIIYLDLGKLTLPFVGIRPTTIDHLACYQHSYLASAYWNNLILWNLNTGMHTSYDKVGLVIEFICIDLYGIIFYGDVCGSIHQLHPQGIFKKESLKISHQSITALKNLPDGTLIAASEYGTLCYFDQTKDFIRQIININSRENIEVLSDGRIIACGENGKIIVLEFPHRLITSEDIWLILLELKTNNSVSLLNLSGIQINDNDCSTLDALVELKNKGLQIIGMPSIS